jgi:hypothetical protein
MSSDPEQIIRIIRPSERQRLRQPSQPTGGKARENRVRRLARRQGLRLVKSRRRDPRALDYGEMYLVDVDTDVIAAGPLHSLSEVETELLDEAVLLDRDELHAEVARVRARRAERMAKGERL